MASVVFQNLIFFNDFFFFYQNTNPKDIYLWVHRFPLAKQQWEHAVGRFQGYDLHSPYWPSAEFGHIDFVNSET